MPSVECHLRTGYPVRHALFIIDVTCSHSGVGPTLKPVLGLDYSEFPRACTAVMGSMLYVFGGTDYSKCRFETEDGLEFYSAYWCSGVYVYDIKKAMFSSSSPSETTVLQKSDADHILEMEGSKIDPLAAKIDDHRICVFSSDLVPARHPPSFPCSLFPEPRCTPPNFELLDTLDHSWTPLPDIFDFYPRARMDSTFALCISTYAVKHSALIVYTTRGDLFRMDFNVPNPQWVKLSTLRVPKSYSSDFTSYPVSSVMIGDRILCTPFEVMELGKSRKNYHPIPIKDVAREAVFNRSGGLCLEGHCAYIARCGVPLDYGESVDSGEPCFWLDVLRFPKLSYRSKPVTLKSFRFALDALFVRLEGFPIKDQDIYKPLKQDDIEQSTRVQQPALVM